MAFQRPLISLSVVSHGDADKVCCLLESLKLYETANSIQVLVTSNLPESFDRVEKDAWHSFELIENLSPLGFAHNHNRAFELAKGKYFCILNPDILFIQPVFSKLMKRITETEAVISPLIFDSDNRLQDSFRELPTPLRLLKRKLPAYKFSSLLPDKQGMIRPDWLAGMFMFMHHRTYRQLGGFDEKFYLYFEDVDLCTRACISGIPVFVDSDLKIIHNAQRESRKNLRYFIWHLSSATKFFCSSVYRNVRRGA